MRWGWQPQDCNIPRSINHIIQSFFPSILKNQGLDDFNWEYSWWKGQTCNVENSLLFVGVVQFHRFKATEMLDLIRGKRLVFVGDSINRDRWESVLCMLMGAVKDPKKVYETHGRKITMEKGNYSFKFVVRSDLAILTSYFVGFVAVFWVWFCRTINVQLNTDKLKFNRFKKLWELSFLEFSRK